MTDIYYILGEHRLGRNELLGAAIESSEDAIVVKDLDGIIKTWNQGAERLYGYREEEVLGRSAILLLPPDRTDEEAEILTRIRNGDRVVHLETTRLRKDGTLISVSLTISPVRSADGQIIGASHIARKITERTLMEAATAQLAAIVDSSEDAIISKNLEGIILTWNSGAERIYGYSADEVRWRPISILLPPDRTNEETQILERLKRGEHVDHFETIRIRKDGKPIEVSLTISPIRYSEGRVRGASHIARDISERKTFQAQILQTQKMESLGVLAGGVAHDFNNLLVGILANASLLSNSVPPSSAQRHISEDIVVAAERASALTRQLLAYAGKGRFVIEPVNLSGLIREVNTLVQTSIPTHVHVRLELKEDLPLIEGDSGQLQQVIMNLIINAAEAIGDKAGLVVVTTNVQDVDEQYAQGVWGRIELAPGPYAVMEVQDSGSGIDEATLERIFDPFFTTKFAGRGLGLAAVLGIVHGHKGALKVYSVPGKGSTFKVFFPISDRALQTPAADVSRPELIGNGTILMIDDEEIVRRAATLTLQRYGYDVLAAANGRDAIDIFRRSDQDIALVLLDLTMPGMNGEEVLRELQAIKPSVRVLLSSGFNEVEAIRHFTGKGLAGFIQKPYSSPALAAKVKQVLDAEDYQHKTIVR
jgi:two-component system cell cycle sensor histidine kinase/response regulator CckA